MFFNKVGYQQNLQTNMKNYNSLSRLCPLFGEMIKNRCVNTEYL